MAGETTTASLALDTTAFEATMYHSLRAEYYFPQVATVKATNQTHNGAVVQFNITTDMAAATTPLNESVDVTPVALADGTVDVTCVEYGNAVITTGKLRGVAYMEVDPIAADQIGNNAGLSIDTVARDVLAGGSNVRYSSDGATAPVSRLSVEADDIFVGIDAMRATADLRAANVRPWDVQAYVGYIHPHVSYDLRRVTGTGGWRDPHIYVDSDGIYRGEIGMFESIRFIETPRAPLFADAGSSTTLTDVYATLIVGQQALACAWAMKDGNGPQPRLVRGTTVDVLQRFVPVGWKWLGGFGRFREAAIRRIESASSIGAN
jgi:N4-gp56 family major capsid protein